MQIWHYVNVSFIIYYYSLIIPRFWTDFVKFLIVIQQILPGGFLNHMILCHHVSDTEEKDWFVLRIFPTQSTGIYHEGRDMEVMAIQVAHAAHCGTPLMALFENGVIVGYFPGRCLEYKDLYNPNIARLWINIIS